MVMVKILEGAGHSVRACTQLSDALAVFDAIKPDLVMTNVYLRDGAGHDALAMLKSELPDVPVLMVSGLPDEDIIERWRDQRGFDVFPKPFTASSLLSKVSEMLST